MRMAVSLGEDEPKGTMHYKRLTAVALHRERVVGWATRLVVDGLVVTLG